MAKLSQLALLVALAAFLTGCAAVTNLTPSRYLRTADGLYHFEVKLDSREQALRWDSIKAFVRIGTEEFPMTRVQNLKNRWEVLIPLPKETEVVHYSYRFRYEVNDFGGPAPGNLDSANYRLEIKER
jgi:hypothetical protein